MKMAGNPQYPGMTGMQYPMMASGPMMGGMTPMMQAGPGMMVTQAQMPVYQQHAQMNQQQINQQQMNQQQMNQQQMTQQQMHQQQINQQQMNQHQMNQQQMNQQQMNQQQMNQQQMNQFAVMTNPFYQYMPGGYAMPIASGGFQKPPGYTPSMAAEFKAKEGKRMEQHQKAAAEHRKRLEQEQKHRQFQDQQKRLKEIRSIGTRHQDADSLIQSIIGDTSKSSGSKSKPTLQQQQQQQQTHQQQQQQPQQTADVDDDFGDFMAHPSVDTVQKEAQLPAPLIGGTPTGPAPVEATIPMDQTVSNVAVGTAIDNSTQVEPKPKQQQKDLTSMMMECSDLSDAQRSRHHQKKQGMKDMQPNKVRRITYQASQRSRVWKTDSTDLTELFTLPPEAVSQAETTTKEFVMPKWCTGEIDPPEVYNQVLEACCKDDVIDTDKTYSILIRSQLPREMLGYIWAMCNKENPGVLAKHELFLVLAMVAIAQNNMSIASIHILERCPQAPVPNLGQAGQPQMAPPPVQPVPLVGMSEPPEAMAVQDVSAGFPLANQMIGHDPSHAAVTAPPPFTSHDVSNTQQDDFADFQAAPSVSTSDSFGDFTSVPPPTVLPPSGHAEPVHPPPVQSAVHAPAQLTTSSVHGAPQASGGSDTPSDRYAVLKLTTTQEDDFADFKSSSSDHSLPPIQVTDFPVNDTAASSMSPVLSNKAEPIQPVSSTWVVPPIPGTIPKPDAFTDFKSAPSTMDDDFADFKSAKVDEEKGDNILDKISSLKALVSNSSLFSATPVVVDDSAVNMEDDESTNDTVTEGVGDSIPHTEASVQPPVFTASFDKQDEEDDWANFSSAAPAAPPSTIEWSSTITNVKPKSTDSDINVPPKDIPVIDVPQATTQYKKPASTTSKDNVHNYFSRNLAPKGPVAGTGMSPLDLQPPDLPDDDDDDEFDEFGTFHSNDLFEGGGNRDGISSLTTPYGGLDDFNDFPVPACPSIITSDSFGSQSQLKTSASKDTFDTQSNSSLEFTGWRSQNKQVIEDTQSTNSLELKQSEMASKESTPGGVDSQSVSSLEIGSGDGCNGHKVTTSQDSRSVASLEFKSNMMDGSSNVTTPLENGQHDKREDFGEFSMAEEIPHSDYVQNPRDASEILAQGEISPLADRYSGFMEQPQEDSDAHHLHSWQQCLERCQHLLDKASTTLSSIPSSTVCSELLNSEKGSDYVRDVVEIYRLVCRIKTAVKALSVNNDKLQDQLNTIKITWANLLAFISNTSVMPESSSLNFSKCVVRAKAVGAQERACGVCLLDVNGRSLAVNHPYDGHKLKYGGREYHASCANFWVNCVDSTLPALKLPELL